MRSRRLFLGFFCLFFLTGQAVAPRLPGGRAWGQSSPGRGVNFKLVPNLEPMREGGPTPDFTLPTLAREKVSLKEVRGKLVFLNFWASWCVPCREEMPAIERLYQEFKAKGLVVLAVNVKDRRKKAVEFVKELKLTYPVLFDPDGQVGLLYGAWGLPTTYLIGRDGAGLARLWGPADWYSPGARELMRTLLEVKR